MAVQPRSLGIAALARAAFLLPVLIALGVAIVPPSGSQQASVWPRQPGPDWPQEGSTVEYDLRSSFTAPDGSYQQTTTSRLALTYDGTRWAGTCSGQTTEMVDGIASTSDWSLPSGGLPARAPNDAGLGDVAVVALLDDPAIPDGCHQRGETVVVTQDEGAMGAMRGEELAETSPYQDLAITWDPDAGLVLDWSRMVRGGSSMGRLVATDAFD